MSALRHKTLVCFSALVVGIEKGHTEASWQATDREMDWLLYGPHIYVPYAYQLEPPFFEILGFERTDGHLIVIPDRFERIICLGCSDRFSILKLPAHMGPITYYGSLKEWRTSVDYPYPEALDDVRRDYERRFNDSHV